MTELYTHVLPATLRESITVLGARQHRAVETFGQHLGNALNSEPSASTNSVAVNPHFGSQQSKEHGFHRALS